MDWDEMARPWLEAAPDLEVSFQDVFQALFDTAELTPGETVLDVGCGTGPTLLRAAEAVTKSGRVVGIDVAPPLVAHALERVPSNVEVIVADAGAHHYDFGAFDAIIANFGIMFFQDNEAAFQNLRKAMKKGGRLAATVWSTPQENPWFSIPRKIVDTIVPDVPRPDPAGPGPMRFGDPSRVKGYLENSGWDAEVRSIDVHLSPPGTAEDAAELHMKVTVGMMLKGMDVAEDKLREIRNALVQELRELQGDEGIRVPARIHVVSASAC